MYYRNLDVQPFVLQDKKSSVAGLASIAGKEIKEKKVFLSLVGTTGMGIRLACRLLVRIEDCGTKHPGCFSSLMLSSLTVKLPFHVKLSTRFYKDLVGFQHDMQRKKKN